MLQQAVFQLRTAVYFFLCPNLAPSNEEGLFDRLRVHMRN